MAGVTHLDVYGWWPDPRALGDVMCGATSTPRRFRVRVKNVTCIHCLRAAMDRLIELTAKLEAAERAG